MSDSKAEPSPDWSETMAFPKWGKKLLSGQSLMLRDSVTDERYEVLKGPYLRAADLDLVVKVRNMRTEDVGELPINSLTEIDPLSALADEAD